MKFEFLHRYFVTFLLFGSRAAYACLNPFGCAPKNYDECIADATKRPTELGVKLARQQCYAKWRQPQEELEAAKRTVAAESRASTWVKLPEQEGGIGTWIAKLGQPDMVLGPYACSPLKDAKPPTASCYSYFWKDERSGRYESYFKTEVVNDASKAIWAYWRDSMAN